MKIGEKGTVSFYLQQSVNDNNVRWFGHSMTGNSEGGEIRFTLGN